MDQAKVIDSANSRELRLWSLFDEETHWILAADEDDAWRVYCETYQYGDDVKREDVVIKPVSQSWASQAPFHDEDGKLSGTVLDECQRELRRTVIASTCV